MRHAYQSLLLSLTLVGISFAATDPFLGDWKLDPSKSTYIDVMKIDSLGGDQYSFDFGGAAEKIVVNGTDQPGVQGTVLSVTPVNPGVWKVTRKKDGRMLLTTTWTLSQDGATLTDDYTEFAEDGHPSTMKYLYKRAESASGFAGTWESPMPVPAAVALKIAPYEGSGLSLIRAGQDNRNLRLDGKDYPVKAPGTGEGVTSSSRRLDERTLEIIEKVDGKVFRTERSQISEDLKTLTRTILTVGRSQPNVFVYERQ